jgi:MFS family permease
MSAVTDIGPARGGPVQSDARFLTTLGIGQICSWGTLYYSFPQIAEAMGHELGWSKPELYGAATLGLGLSGFAAYPVGLAIDKGFGRAVMSGASVLAGILMLAWSQVSSLILFYLLFAGIGCLQAATLYEPAFAVVARRFGSQNARRGITALTLWGGFASTVFIPIIQILLHETGWRGVLIVLGLVNIVLCGGLYLTAIRPALDAARPPYPAAPDPQAAPKRGAVAEAMRSSIFWALALSFTAYAATYSAFTFHFFPMMTERGLDSASAVAVMSCIGPAQVAGRIAIWVFASDMSVRRLGSIVVAVFPLAFAGILMFPMSLAGMAAVAILYGGANGIMTIVRGLAVPEMLSRESYGAITGALVAPSLVSRAAAPAGAALLWSATQSYNGVIIATIAGAALTAVGFWIGALRSKRLGPKI